MAYRAVTTFTDLQDNNHMYQAGDLFPRKGFKVSDERLVELSTDKNRRHKPVIEEVLEEKAEKPAPKKGGRKKTDVK